MSKFTPFRRQLLAGCFAATGSWALGTGIGWSAPIEHDIRNGYFGFQITELEYHWISSLMALGAATWCIPTGLIMNLIGPRRTMLMMVIPHVGSWALLAWAQNIQMLYAGRFLVGMFGGAYCVVVPIYSTEIAQTHIRGIIGSTFQILITVGILYAWIVGTLFNVFVMTILCGILPLIFAVFFYFLPESPVFLLKRDRMRRAKGALKQLRGSDYNIYIDLIEMEANLDYVTSRHLSFCKGMCRRSTRKSLILSSLIMIFQQTSGINIVMFNVTELLRMVHASLSPHIDIIIIGTAQVAVTCFCTLFIDRYGRRILLMVAAFSLSLACMGIGIFYRVFEHSEETAQKIAWLPVFSFVTYIVMYSVGMGAIPWLFNAEIFAEDVKAFGSAIAATINWLTGFAVTSLYVYTEEITGLSNIFFLYGIVTLFIFFFVLMFMPETMHKTFKEIQAVLELDFF